MYQYAEGISPSDYQMAIGVGSPYMTGFESQPSMSTVTAGIGGGNMPPPLPASFGGAVGGTTLPAAGGTPATGGTTLPAPGGTTTPAPATGGATPPATTPAAPIDYNAAFDNFKNFIGYDFALKQAMDALNHQYAAAGQLQSGAAAKGIADYAANIAQQGAAFPYLNYLSGQQAMGAGAASSIAGVGQNFGNAVTGINGQTGSIIQNGANSAANGQIIGGLANAGMWNNVGSALGNLGSSIFAPGASTGSFGAMAPNFGSLPATVSAGSITPAYLPQL
jgi:hypothetical protein